MGITKATESVLILTSTGQAIDNVQSNLNTVEAQLYSHIDDRIRVVDTRQTVLAGKIDSNGYSNYLVETSTGLIGIDTSMGNIPLIITFANGYTYNGINDYISEIDTDTSPIAWDLSGESDNDYYLYIENDGFENLTYGKTTVQPQYGYNKGSAGTSGLDYFVIPEMKFYYDNGSTWTQKYRVYVGEVNKASSVYTIKSYAIRGVYFVDWTSVPGAGNTDSYDHNIGVNENLLDVDGYVKLATTGRILRFYRAYNGANNNYDLDVYDLSTVSIDIKQMNTPSVWYAGGDNNNISQYSFKIKRNF